VTLAFEHVCRELGLTVKYDPATRIVAEKIIAPAKNGIEESQTLCDLTLRSSANKQHEPLEGGSTRPLQLTPAEASA
jgi:hypothetical protein